MTPKLTIREAVKDYLSLKADTHSLSTARTYQNALKAFLYIVKVNQITPEENPPTDLPEDAIAWFAASLLKSYAPSTQQLYLTAVIDFYEYLVAEQLSDVHLPRIRQLAKRYSRRPGQRLPQFEYENIEHVINYAIIIAITPTENKTDRMRNLRDSAFILTLADTGLRVHEACALKRGSIDWNEGRAIVIGKGNREAVVRFSTRSLRANKTYLAARATLDGASGQQLSSLPLFARHDRGTGKHVLPITTTTGRNIIKLRVREALGDAAAGTITPHSFRHYFVTVVLRASGNLKLAQELARHRNIAVTQRYAHLSDDELDKGYTEIFNR